MPPDADMGKTVSGYLRRGLRLVENAARGPKPKGA